MSKILTSDEFIQSVRRRCMAPENTEVYDDMDILEIASEEIAVEIMPALLSIHEGYMLTHIDISIEQDKNKYRIPETISNKFVEIFVNAVGKFSKVIIVSVAPTDTEETLPANSISTKFDGLI